MSREERLELIREIESERKSKVLVYITGDRRGLETKIGIDTFPFINRHISQFDRPPKIDLFLYSTGGITMAGYSLVNMIREHTESFGVLIPFKALSTATLITFGSDDIIMTKMGQLSPIDPSIPHPLGPQIPIQGQPGTYRVLPVSVEDIFNYFDLARTELKISEEDNIEDVLEYLSQNVHPLVLGNAYRAREQIGLLAHNLLSYHFDDEEKISDIIKIVTKGRFSHNYIFNRKEAKNDLGLPIIDNDRVESLIISLFEKYQQMLELPNPYSPEVALGEEDESRISVDQAIIESDDLTHVFRSVKLLRRITIQLPHMPVPVPTVIERIISQGWVEDNTI